LALTFRSLLDLGVKTNRNEESASAYGAVFSAKRSQLSLLKKRKNSINLFYLIKQN